MPGDGGRANGDWLGANGVVRSPTLDSNQRLSGNNRALSATELLDILVLPAPLERAFPG